MFCLFALSFAECKRQGRLFCCAINMRLCIFWCSGRNKNGIDKELRYHALFIRDEKSIDGRTSLCLKLMERMPKYTARTCACLPKYSSITRHCILTLNLFCSTSWLRSTNTGTCMNRCIVWGTFYEIPKTCISVTPESQKLYWIGVSVISTHVPMREIRNDFMLKL